MARETLAETAAVDLSARLSEKKAHYEKEREEAQGEINAIVAKMEELKQALYTARIRNGKAIQSLMVFDELTGQENGK